MYFRGQPLSADALFSYWEQDGIANVAITGAQEFYTDQTDTQGAVQDYGALLAELQFVNGDHLGDFQVTAGSHMLVVDGYTPEGPLVVTWGQTVQMSWQQWDAEAVGTFEIAGASVLQYEIDSQRGSHRKLVSRAGYPPLPFSSHDGETLGPVLVGKILITDVGLSEQKAKEVL